MMYLPVWPKSYEKKKKKYSESVIKQGHQRPKTPEVVWPMKKIHKVSSRSSLVAK